MSGGNCQQDFFPAQSFIFQLGVQVSVAENCKVNPAVSEKTLLDRICLLQKIQTDVGLVGKNLWMIYCKAPFDPELTTSAASNFYQGFDAYMLPSTRNFGFNVKFQF